MTPEQATEGLEFLQSLLDRAQNLADDECLAPITSSMEPIHPPPQEDIEDARRRILQKLRGAQQVTLPGLIALSEPDQSANSSENLPQACKQQTAAPESSDGGSSATKNDLDHSIDGALSDDEAVSIGKQRPEARDRSLQGKRGASNGVESRQSRSRLRGIVSSITWLLLWIAAVDQRLLRRAPRAEAARYTALGASIIVSSTTVGLSAAIVAASAVVPWPLTALIGIVFGLFALTLQRAQSAARLMTRRRRPISIFQFFGKALPVVLLTLMVALLVATPLALRLFSTEIAFERVTSTSEQQAQLQQAVLSSPQLQDLRAGLNSAQVQYEVHLKKYHDEVQGTGGTGVSGLGAEAAFLKEQVDRDQLQVDRARAQIDAAMASADQQIQELNARISSTGGVVQQLDALSSLSHKEPAVGVIYLIMIGIFGFLIAGPSISLVASTYREPTLYELLTQIHGRFAIVREELAVSCPEYPISDYESNSSADWGGNESPPAYVEQRVARAQEESVAEVISIFRRTG